MSHVKDIYSFLHTCHTLGNLCFLNAFMSYDKIRGRIQLLTNENKFADNTVVITRGNSRKERHRGSNTGKGGARS